jgi:phosphatidylinositol N-acetylglucosaminyltransferase subunit A
MSNGLKVYYCPLVPFYDQDVWPTLYAFFPLFRHILLRERVSIVHTHQATSVMSIEAALFARTMGWVSECLCAHPPVEGCRVGPSWQCRV